MEMVSYFGSISSQTHINQWSKYVFVFYILLFLFPSLLCIVSYSWLWCMLRSLCSVFPRIVVLFLVINLRYIAFWLRLMLPYTFYKFLSPILRSRKKISDVLDYIKSLKILTRSLIYVLNIFCSNPFIISNQTITITTIIITFMFLMLIFL